MIEQCAQSYSLERFVHHRQACRAHLAQLLGGSVAGDQYGGDLVVELRPQLAERIDADAFAAQTQVGDDEVRRAPVDALENFRGVHRGDALAAPALQQALHAEAHRLLVVDHDDELAADQVRHLLLDRLGDGLDAGRIGNRHFDREARALADRGAQPQRMAEQLHDAPYGREPEAEAARAVPSRIVELIELLEDALVLLSRNADARVPDLDLGNVAAPPAGDDDAALFRVAQRVGDKVRQHAEQQRSVRREGHLRAARRHAQTLVLRRTRERTAQPIEHRVHRHDLAFHFHLSGVELRDVQQVVEQLLERFRALQDLVDQRLAGAACRIIAQRRREQSERVQRLAQVVIRGCEEQRFRAIRFFGAGARLLRERVLALQLVHQLLVLVTQPDLRNYGPRLSIDEQQHVAEYGDPHHAERSVAVAAERYIAQRQQAEDRHRERVQRRREVCVRDDAERRAARETGGDQSEGERLVGPDEHEHRGAPHDAGDASGSCEPPTPTARRGVAIACATIRT